jgi:hypothetical protein
VSGSRGTLDLRPASLHTHRHGSVLVPVNVLGLAPEVVALGERWAVKEEFHVTAVSTPWLAERLGRDLDEVSGAAAEVAAASNVTRVTVRDELRVVRRDEERTIVVMADVEGLDGFIAALAERLGAPVPAPPAHVTLYTRPGGGGIGLHEDTDLAGLTCPADLSLGTLLHG